jgi:hypothetical protein
LKRGYLNLNYFKLSQLSLIGVLLISAPRPVYAQTGDSSSQQSNQSQSKDTDENSPEHPKALIKHLGQDQVAIWTSPFKMKASDLKWVVPFVASPRD